MASETSVSEIARSLIGVPYRHQGRDIVNGIDCVGVLVHIAKRLGLDVIDRIDYSPLPDGTLVDQLQKNLIEVYDNGAYNPGDVLVFWIRKRGLAAHVGVVTESGFVHAISTYDHVIEQTLSSKWIDRVTNVFRFPSRSE